MTNQHMLAQREQMQLASYAMHSEDSIGRKFAEPEHPYRGAFQRDRDRILHSSAYRRLSGKMQVFTGDMGDYHRTRLTHTQEVASIARTIGRALRLNEDLIEALALLHDIGHPPFGHAGEDALNECLADHGGFSHNRQALTIVEELESRYPDFPGLNLSRETLEGQLIRAHKEAPDLSPLLEVQVVEAADSITYDAHDTDDAIKLGMLTIDQVSTIPLIHDVVSRVRSRHTGLSGSMLRKAMVHELVDVQVSDVLREAFSVLNNYEGCTATELRQADFRIGPGSDLGAQKGELEKFLHETVYRHPQLMEVRTVSQNRLKEMYLGYLEDSSPLPNLVQNRAEVVGMPVSICDYLAGMTDRFCDAQFHQHFENSPRGILPGGKVGRMHRK
ncbi:MAG: dNTP triphosphohydrolase [Pirellulaceae bacterium]|jgi:dGTPase|nr:dNTP triphosphohydrolase [Pirellulaceae bacterium]